MRPARPGLVVAFSSALASCSLLLETVPHRLDSGITIIDGATADGTIADSSLDGRADSSPSDDTGSRDDATLDGGEVDAIDGGPDLDALDVHGDGTVSFDGITSTDAFDVTRDAADAGFDVTHDAFDGFTTDAIIRDASDAGLPDAVGDVTDVRLVDATTDVGFVDATTDIGFVDAIVRIDAISTIDVAGAPCATDSDCFPQWCGCGTCTMDQVVCGNSATAASCSLGCPVSGSCPYVENVTCGCSAGACFVASRGGSSPAGTPCTSSTQCQAGLLCCYPCGIDGCTNVCMDPTPEGTCPIPL